MISDIADGELPCDDWAGDEELADDAGPQSRHLFTTLVIDAGQLATRLDRYLASRLEGASRTFIQKTIGDGMVHVNGALPKPSYCVQPGDVLEIYRAGEAPAPEILPEDIALDIVYEDDSMLVVNKPAGMVVHPGHGHFSGTLVNALMYHLREVPLFQAGGIRPGLAHRIDKDTSGLLAVGKTERAMRALSMQFFHKTASRAYLALVWGRMEGDEGTIDKYVGRDPSDRQRMCVFSNDTQGKRAVTHWRRVESLAYTTLIDCRLETGRMHQIRVHMQSVKHPLFNDTRYGGDRILRGVDTSQYRNFVQHAFSICPRQALHAYELTVQHPVTGECLRLTAPMPADMAALLEYLRTWH